MQAVAFFSDASKGLAVVFSAYTGKVIKHTPLPGPVTHIQSLGEGANARTGYLLAALSAPFPTSTAVHTYPADVALPAGKQQHLWAADHSSGPTLL